MGTWITQVSATYESTDDAKSALEAIRADSFTRVERRGRRIIVLDEYGERSKYAAARPIVETLRELFDPVADDDYYRPWPVTVGARTRWMATKVPSR